MWRSILARALPPFLLGVLSCSLAVFVPIASHSSAEEGSSGKIIDNLIAELGSDSFDIREAATCKLKELLEAIPALRKDRRTANLEVRRRVDDILLALERKRALRGLSKARALGKAGRVVEVADRLAFAANYGVAGDEGWESLTQFADRIIARTGSYFRYFPLGWESYCKGELPVGEFRRYAKQVNPKEVAESKIEIDTGRERDSKDVKLRAANKFIRDNYGRFLFRGEEVYLTGIAPLYQLVNGMIVASGDVQVTSALGSVIISGGNVNKVERLMNCILICDGDVELLNGWEVKDSIIIAHGKVTWKQGKRRDCLVRSNHSLLLPDGKTIDLKAGTPDPLAFVKFFELTDVGNTAEDVSPREKSDAGGVRLKDVRKGSPFATGLCSGDVIIAIEERKTPTTEIFRRVLRRKLAEGGPILTFTVRRSGKTLDVPLPVKD